jgi:hypothetical protein
MKENRNSIMDYSKKIDSDRRKLGNLKIENPLEGINQKLRSLSCKSSPLKLGKSRAPMNSSVI